METSFFSKTYQSLCTEYYDLDKPSAPKEALEYYLQKAEEAKGLILEPMCGTGRFLLPLVEAGYDVTGFDNSSQMLDICRKKCQAAKFQCNLEEASFEDFKTTEQFQLIFIPSGSFCLLTDPKMANNALDLVHNWLKADGKFIFEIETLNAVDTSPGVWKANWVKKEDGSLIVINHIRQFDSLTKVETVLCRYEHWKNNSICKTEVEEFCLRLYSTQEIEELLNQHGFNIERRLKPYSCEIAQEDTEVILYECTKVNK